MTLDDDLAAELQRLARERGTGLEDVLNAVVRAGLARPGGGTAHRMPTRPMRLRPGVDLTRALALAADDEDVETLRKMALRERSCST